MPFSYKRLNRCFNSKGGEEVVYCPSGKQRRRITAIVDRQPRVQILDGRPAPLAIIEVDNDAVTGITRGELDEGLDRIEVAVEEGGAPETRDIGAVAYSDAGRIGLEVR